LKKEKGKEGRKREGKGKEKGRKREGKGKEKGRKREGKGIATFSSAAATTATGIKSQVK
jgi:hypothetical protein